METYVNTTQAGVLAVRTILLLFNASIENI